MTPNNTDVQTLLDHLADLALELTTCNDTLSATEAAMDACGCASNGTQSETNACAGTGGSVDDPSYNLPLHVGAVFIVLAVSSAGVALPILAAKSGRLGVDGYWIQLGKLVGTGIVLACGLIHMLQPAAAALTGECVPGAFNEDYPAYAFLYCMIAALALHVFDTLMRLYMVESSAASASASSSAVAAVAVAIEDGVKNPLGPSDAGPGATVEAVAHDPKLAGAILAMRLAAASHDLVLRRVVQSYSMEFAFTVHSIFIGLTVGVVDSDELSALLTALAFHQFFEGIALGSRLADAELPPVQTFLFALVFAVSAPVGIACGIAYIVSVNPDGVVYSLVQGTFDGVCAGFLLFVGFQLLLTDFPVDMAMHANSTKPRYKLRRFGMFLALWVGAGFMALIGRYL